MTEKSLKDKIQATAGAECIYSETTKNTRSDRKVTKTI